MRTVCLAILNYDGKEHLRELLPTAEACVEAYGKPCPIIVLDNQSPGDDVAWVRKSYPKVETVVSPKNDFLFSYNWLLKERPEEVVILLNNDLKLSPNLISCLLQHFSDSTTFAVSCKAFTWDGASVNSGPCTFKIRRGWLRAYYQHQIQRPSYTLFASGGFMAVDRKKFLELGGFDRLYHPAYGEDKDLGYRAWCRGWKSVYEPGCHVFHREGGSWDSQAERASQALMERTDYFFMWRNLRHLSFRLLHGAHLAALFCLRRMKGDVRWLQAFDATRRLWAERRQEALRNAPPRIDLGYLKAICGSPLNGQAPEAPQPGDL